MLVSELMTRTVRWIAPTTTLIEAARHMLNNNIGCLLVGENDAFIGIVTEKDFARRGTAQGLGPSTNSVRQIMTRGIYYCQEGDTAEDAMQLMDDRQVHHLPVRNAADQVTGIVSLSDLALKGPQSLFAGASNLAFRRRDQVSDNSLQAAGTPGQC
jgi:CBS domain-containing protein